MTIVVWHGESGSLFYIVSNTDGDDWDIITSFNNRTDAEAFIDSEG